MATIAIKGDAAVIGLYDLLPGGLYQRCRRWICPLDWVVEFIPARSRLLDAGCGSGILIEILSRDPSRSLVGIDCDRAKLRQAAVLVSGRPNVELRCRSFEDLLEGEIFDSVIAVDFIHHSVKPPIDVLRKAFRHIRPGGGLIVKEMDPSVYWRRWLNTATDWLVSGSVPTCYLSPTELSQMAMSVGFRPRQTTFHSRPFLSYHYLEVFLRP